MKATPSCEIIHQLRGKCEPLREHLEIALRASERILRKSTPKQYAPKISA